MNSGGAEPTVEQRGRFLFVHLPERCRALSWAIVGGGLTTTRAVAWWQVSDGDLTPEADPVHLLQEQLEAHGLREAIGLLTSRRLDRYIDVTEHGEDLAIRTVATLGLSNGVSVGDPATYRSSPSQGADGRGKPGTINIHCHIDQALTDSALIEALALISEARTAELLANPLISPLSGSPITGTGTDCVAVTCPIRRMALPYAGKHCEVGSLLGRAVRRAISEGFQQWRLDREREALEEKL